MRLAHARQLHRAVRRHGRRAVADCRRHHARQDQHGRVCDGLVERDELLWARPQSVGSRARAGRLVRRFCGRSGSAACTGGDGHGHGRLDSSARRALRHHGHQAHLRASVALRHDRVRVEPRSGRRAHAIGRRRGAAARSDGRFRRARLDVARRARAALLADRERAVGRHHDRRARELLRRGARRRQCEGAARRARRAREAGRKVEEHRAAEHSLVGARVLRRRARRSIVESVALRRRTVRSSRRAPRRGLPRVACCRRGSHDVLHAQSRRGLRCRSEAPDSDRHLRAVRGLLRCVLPASAEGAQAHQRRLRARLPRRRLRRRADDAVAGVRPGPENERPDRDVPERHLHDRRELGRPARDVDAVRFRAQAYPSACSSSRRRWPKRGCSKSGTISNEPRIGTNACRRATRERNGLGNRHRPRDPRAARDQGQNLLRRVDDLRRVAEQSSEPRRLGLPRRAARVERRSRHDGRQVRPRDELRDRAALRVRAQKLLLPGSAERLSDQSVRAADRARRPSRRRARRRQHAHRRPSSARISRKTPASRCTRTSRACRAST